MSLVVWLPLNGNLENQGISAVTITNNGATVDNNGKIGKCYSFDGSDDYFQLSGFDPSGFEEMSIACWCKPITTFDGLFLIRQGGVQHDFRIGPSYIYFRDTNNTSSLRSLAFNNQVPTDTWTHLVCVYKKGEIWIYQNGILDMHDTTYMRSNSKLRTNLSEVRIARTQSTSGNIYYSGLINDFRIYNHALSAAEVHEISQGLVLHYKLDSFQGGYGNPNLLPANDTTFFNTTRSFEFEGWVKNFYTTTWVNEHLTAGQQYTLSYTVTCISIPDTSIYSVSETRGSPILVHQGSGWSQVTTTNDGIRSTNLLPGQSRTYKCTFTFATATESQGYYGFCGYTCLYRNADRTSSAYARFRIDNLKLELGSDATPWVPNINDESVDVSHIQDSSGYGHNGSIYGTTQLISGSPRYSTAIELTSTSSHINASDLVTSGFGSSYSFVWWGKSNSTTNMHWGFSNGIRLNGLYNGNLWNTGDSSNNPLYKPGTTTGISVTEANVWHHWAMTGDGTTCKLYKDGIHVANAKTWKAISGTSLWFNGWQNSTSYAASSLALSDFRLYATTLSADDIKQLYQVSAKVDNLQNLHTFEIKETNRNLLAGRLWSNSFSQHNPGSGLFTNFNSNGEYQFTTNSTSAGSEYIPITPTGHTYEYDYTISVNAGNKFYIGFERYDADKTARSNNACVYTYSTKPSSDIVKQHFHGTVDLSTDGTNPCAFIALRILNGWSGTTSGVTGTATIHSFSLREIGTKQQPKLTKQGQFIEEELKEESNMKLHKNGIIETNNLIEL